MELKYRWGFDYFRTPRRYGLGIEVHINGTFLIGIRVGSLWLSWGEQLARGPFVSATAATAAPASPTASPPATKDVMEFTTGPCEIHVVEAREYSAAYDDYSDYWPCEECGSMHKGSVTVCPNPDPELGSYDDE